MTQGRDVGEFGAMDGPYIAPPEDTGEAMDCRRLGSPSRSVSGPACSRMHDGKDRFGLAARRPAALADLPHFAGDNLDPARSGGDLCVQACSDDPQVAVHAIRNLARIGFGTASVRWSQLGFGRTSSTSDAQTTPRNLFGFKDGTNNVKAEHHDTLDQFVWVGSDDDACRRLAGRWQLSRGASHQHAHRDLGPHLAAGAGGHHRARQEAGGTAVGRQGVHRARLLHGRRGRCRRSSPSTLTCASPIPAQNGGSHILRRGYNFTDGSNGLGNLDAGLFFIAYTRDPVQHFIPLQTNLARHDALNEYIQHTGSALFAVPPGVSEGDYVGSALFA